MAITSRFDTPFAPGYFTDSPPPSPANYGHAVLTVSITDALTALALWGLAFGVAGVIIGYCARPHHHHDHKKGHR